MSEATIPASTDSINSSEPHPLVKELRSRSTHLKKASYLYLGLILSALLIGRFLFYKLPIWLIEQDEFISSTQQLFVKKGTLQAQRDFTQSRWKNQRKNAAGAVFDNGQKLASLSVLTLFTLSPSSMMPPPAGQWVGVAPS